MVPMVFEPLKFYCIYKRMNTKAMKIQAAAYLPTSRYFIMMVMPISDIVTLCNIKLRSVHSSSLCDLVITKQTITQVISGSRMRLMEHFGRMTSTDKQSVSSSRLMIWLLCCHL